MPFGLADWRGILQSVSKRDYLRYVCYLAEMGVTETKKNKKQPSPNALGGIGPIVELSTNIPENIPEKNRKKWKTKKTKHKEKNVKI